jgi:hypothetical protein
VIPWILAADVMIHPDCTTGVESYMLGRTPISYLQGQNIISTFLPVHVSHRCQDEDELTELMLSERYPGLIDETDTLLDEYFSFSKDSTDLIVERVHQMISARPRGEEQGLSAYHRVKVRAKETLRPYYYRLMGKDLSLYQNKLTGLNPDSVYKSLDMMCSAQGDASRVKVRAISSQLFLIHP